MRNVHERTDTVRGSFYGLRKYHLYQKEDVSSHLVEEAMLSIVTLGKLDITLSVHTEFKLKSSLRYSWRLHPNWSNDSYTHTLTIVRRILNFFQMKYLSYTCISTKQIINDKITNNNKIKTEITRRLCRIDFVLFSGLPRRRLKRLL